MSEREASFTHQITRPEPGRDYLPQERLLAQAEGYLNRRLILVQAPAGYGKTGFLSAFAQRARQPTAWVTVTEHDRDPQRLSRVIRASLLRRFRRLEDALTESEIAGVSGLGLSRALAGAVRARIPEPFLLLFDNIHLVNDSDDALALLDGLLVELPPSVTLVMAGRALPRLELAPLVIDSEVGGLGVFDLALTRSELGQLAAGILGREPESSEVEELYASTQGWVAGARLMLSLPGMAAGQGPLDESAAVDLLRGALIDRQEPGLRRFLLDSSVLPLITTDACDRILERVNSRSMIERARSAGLFLAQIHSNPDTYEYHPLFRQALLARLEEEDSERRVELTRAAAAHYEAGGSVERALELYRDGGLMEDVGRLAESAARELFESGRIGMLEYWAEWLRERSVQLPDLYLYMATATTYRGQLDKAYDWITSVKICLEGRQRDLNMDARLSIVQGQLSLQRGKPAAALECAESAWQILSGAGDLRHKGECLRLLALSRLDTGGDLERAEAESHSAIDLFKEAKDTYRQGLALLDLSAILSARGRLDESHKASLRAHEQFILHGAPIPLAISLNNLAVLAHKMGRYQEAVGLFTQALSQARRAGSRRYEASILLGQGDLFNDLGLQHQAGDLYGQALGQAVEAGSVHLIAYGYLQTSRLHRRCGNVELAREWLDRARQTQGNGYVIDYEIQSQALDLPVSPERAQSRLLELYNGINPDRNPNHAVETLCFLAQAELMLGQEQEAAAHLGRAFDLASLHGAAQVPAGESVYDGWLLELGRRRLPGHPMLGQLAQRLELVGWIASQYGGSGEYARRRAKLELQALAGAEVWLEGNRVHALAPLPRQLLFFLADRMPVDRDTILEEFWPAAEPKRQKSSLYSAVHSIKGALGEESVAIDGSLYRLNLDWEISYDVARFESAAAAADAIPPTDARRIYALKEALARYGGAFLPEYDEEWVLIRRRALELEMLRLLDKHADEASLAGQPKEAAASLERALKLDPLREDLLYRYLELLGQLGRRSEIVRHYLAYVDRLADELGLTPSGHLRQLYSDLIT